MKHELHRDTSANNDERSRTTRPEQSGFLKQQRRLTHQCTTGIATSPPAGTKKRINELANGCTLMNRPVPSRKWNNDISLKEIFSRERAWDSPDQVVDNRSCESWLSLHGINSVKGM
ncbi:unnamed protein product [Heterotrigona itama]|uniref:Uncharacterized protein n=1 Tax=Heterotrigona itama TaxID=395501 RepID=A0A6V7HEV1_9HYME|nr:unnamed protein product [Heterotrigona itama]